MLQLNTDELHSRTVFIVEKFEGSSFEFLINSKATVLGPRVLITMLMNDVPLPVGPKPVFTFAMKDMVVTASSLTPTKKKDIERKVKFLGGVYFQELNDSVTHLISNSVFSLKYETAALKKLPIMDQEWIEDVWTHNQEHDVLANDKLFDHHKLKIFHKLSITSTNLSAAEREVVRKLINDNGGEYTGGFESTRTDILIVPPKKADGKKFAAAIQFKKLCLTPDWITDSCKHGYAQGTEKYKVGPTVKASTPERTSFVQGANRFGSDTSQISDISCIPTPNNNGVVDETTVSVDGRTPLAAMPGAGAVPKRKTVAYQEALDRLDLTSVKKAKAFLDGCKVFLSGFQPADKDKLIKVLNSSGAVRLDELNNQVTHMVVGEPVPNDFTLVNEKSLG